jgi:uncharacterized membrane protein YgcG
MKKTLALLLLACACVRAQEEPNVPPLAPPPELPSAVPTAPPPTLPAAPPTTTLPMPAGQPPRMPPSGAATGGQPTFTTNSPEANAERLEALKRQFQERMAARTNAGINLPAVRPSPVRPAGAAPTAGLPGPAAALAAPGAPAAPAAGRSIPTVVPDGDEVVTNMMQFPSVDLNTFLDFYASFQRRMILRPSGLPAQTITFIVPTGITLTRREMIDAMDTVLSMNGVSTILVGDKFVKVVTTQDALTAAAPVSTLGATNIPEAGQYMVQIVQLRYTKPSVIAPLLAPFGKIASGVVPIEENGIIVLRDFAENIKRMLHIIELVDVAIPSEFISEVIPIKYARAGEIASALGNLGGGGSGATIGGSGSSGGSMGGGMMGGGSRGMGGMGGMGGMDM